MTEIHTVEWIPKNEPIGVLQICHGMVEYIERYDEFARFLCDKGYYVVGHDHIGHGQSIQNEENYGHFHEKSGNEYVVGDIHQIRVLTEKKHCKVPYYMLGHSMGSFLLRQYLTEHSKGVSGAIIMGTGYKGAPIINGGIILCKMVAAFKGWNYRSGFINNLGLGGYNKKFEPGESPKDWVTSDKQKRKEYLEDPLCSFMFTVGAYCQLFTGLKTLTVKDNLAKMDKALPILFVAGEDDPVGDFGKGVKKVYHQFRAIGMRDVSIKLYPGDRHEILNETDRTEVYEDIVRWIQTIKC